MKKLTKFFALIFLSCLAFSAGAQVNFGIKAGGNLSNVHQNFKDSDNEYATKFKPGFHIGITADLSFSDNLSFQPGILFTTKGWGYDLDELFDEDDFGEVKSAGFDIDGYWRTSLNYIEIPLNFAFKHNDLQIYAGPYVAVGIGGKQKADFTASYMGYSETVKDEMKIKPFFGEVKEGDLKEDEGAFNALDFGLNFGLGYMIGPILVQGGYSLGLANTNPKYEGATDSYRDDYKTSNRVITLSVSYFFGN